ncbi:hypothetical protein [Falsirhodobacter halotolerans]|uniref:hypothetical protein n=1 Tax=Falsirhodobacter halotolerans TaxID=1146892 RepID=UPI001FD281F4|nr:hypothetical protein [Falsirhodobacter halotolerans]MCJ8140015.1 hypothetical protein [Falsirhodobacter halotolerans]
MPPFLIFASLVGGSAGFLLLGPDFAASHSMKEQIALGLLAVVMIGTLFGMRIQTMIGFVLRMVVLALVWRFAAQLLRLVRLR